MPCTIHYATPRASGTTLFSGSKWCRMSSLHNITSVEGKMLHGTKYTTALYFQMFIQGHTSVCPSPVVAIAKVDGGNLAPLSSPEEL